MTAVRLRYVLRLHEETGHAREELLSVYRRWGVIRKSERDDNFNKPGEDLSRYQLVRPGDLVMNRMKAWQGSLGISPHQGIVSPDYYVIRVDTSVAEPAFLHHLLRSRFIISEYAARSTGIRSNQWRLSWDAFRDIKVHLPPLAEQRAIAAFLNRETERIEDLRRELTDAVLILDEQLETVFDGLVADAPGTTTVPLRRVITSITDGPFGSSLSSAHYVEAEEVRVIRLGNIGRAELVDRDRAFVATEYANEALAEHYLSPGDIVVAGLGDANQPLARACVIPNSLGPAIHKADCYRVVADPSRCDPCFLALSLSFGPARYEAPLLSRGATRARLNTLVARDLPVTIVDRPAQASIVAEFDKRRAEVMRLREEYQALDGMLEAYREALINEAALGRFHAPVATNARMDETHEGAAERIQPEVLA